MQRGVASVIDPISRCPEGIELVLVDLDDTVLADGTKLSPRVVNAMNLARERGVMMCVSSGRPFTMVPETLRSPAAMDYLICTNGATIYDTHGQTLFERPISRDDVLCALDALKPLRPGWNCFIEGEAYFEWRGFTYMAAGRVPKVGTISSSRAGLHTGMARFTRKVLRTARRMIINDEGRHQVRSIRPAVEEAASGVQKLGCSFTTPAACERAVAILTHMGSFQIARMGGQELEITADGVTKATAARWLMDYLKIGPVRAVAFGDSQNDAPLAEACGTFVAMGNAIDSVKAMADDVCETVYDDGVARWLERAMAEADGAKHV